MQCFYIQYFDTKITKLPYKNSSFGENRRFFSGDFHKIQKYERTSTKGDAIRPSIKQSGRT